MQAVDSGCNIRNRREFSNYISAETQISVAMRKRQPSVLGNVNYVHRHVKNSAVEPDDRLVMARDQMSPLEMKLRRSLGTGTRRQGGGKYENTAS